MREWERTLSLALVLSAGLHLVAVLALDAAPLGAGHGIRQELRLLLRGEEPAAGKDASPAVPPTPRSHTAAPQPGHPPADRYYRKAEVDAPAIPISRVPLLIPEHAYYSRLVGKVRARVFIGADGGVDKVQILEAEPVRGLFEDAALDALRGMRYQAARIGGRAVKSQKVVDVVFNPRADDPDPGE